MDRISLYKLIGLPETFGVLLLTFSFILLLAPYFSGADFGLFKIPIFGEKGRRWLKIIGPVVLLVCAFPFLPVFTVTNKTNDDGLRVASSPSPIISPSQAVSQTLSPQVSPPISTSPNLSEQRQEAEKLATDWFAALLRGDVNALVQMSDLPFFFDQEIFVTQEDLRTRYQEIVGKQGGRSPLRLQSIRVQTIAEMKKAGYDTRRDRLLDSLNLDEDDFAIVLMVKSEQGPSEEGIGLYTRKRGKEIKLAGWWD